MGSYDGSLQNEPIAGPGLLSRLTKRTRLGRRGEQAGTPVHKTNSPDVAPPTPDYNTKPHDRLRRSSAGRKIRVRPGIALRTAPAPKLARKTRSLTKRTRTGGRGGQTGSRLTKRTHRRSRMPQHPDYKTNCPRTDRLVACHRTNFPRCTGEFTGPGDFGAWVEGCVARPGLQELPP